MGQPAHGAGRLVGWRVYEVARERGDGAASVGGAVAAVGVGGRLPVQNDG